MFEVDAFIVRGHEKVIDHLQRLRDSTASDVERQLLQKRMDQESEALRQALGSQPRGAQRAA